MDYIDQIDGEVMRAIKIAAPRAGVDCDVVTQRLAPAAEGWRDKLAELEDWGQPSGIEDEWAVINERVTELKALFSRSVTPDDLADIGRRCRELMIASANATYRPWMLPEGKEPPKESDAKTKCKYIVEHIGSNSLDKRLTTLIDKAWDLSVKLSHYKEPARTATFAAAQSAILVVRTLGMIEGDLVAAGEDNRR